MKAVIGLGTFASLAIAPAGALAQGIPAPGPVLPEMVGPIADPSPAITVYDPQLPEDTPDEISALDLSKPVTDLADALVRAYWFNPQILAERASLRSSDYRLPQARARYGPSIDYVFNFDWRRDDFDTVLGTRVTRSGQTNTAAAILTQPVYTFGRLAANERGARAGIAFQRASLRNTEQQILFAAISAYVGLLRDRTGLQIAQDNLALLEKELEDNRARFNVRETTSSDVEQVLTRTAFARAELLQAQTALATSEANFRSVIGSEAGELQPPFELSLPVTSLENAVNYAEANNPVLDAAHAREQASRAGADAAFAERLPRVDVQGRVDFDTSGDYSNDLRQTSLQGGIVLSGPLFDGGLLAARQKEAEAANDADWRLIDQALRDIRAEVQTTWSSKNTSVAAVDHLAVAVDSARKAYDGALIQQRAGFRTTLDVLNLARDLLTVRNSYNTTVANSYLAQARLLLALGAMDQSLLLPRTLSHDPARHTEQVDGYGDLPLWTPVLDALDGIGYERKVTPRPSRDGAPNITDPG